MPSKYQIALGLDFGTEAVRALLVDLEGNEQASAVVNYEHGQLTETLPCSDIKLEADDAFQHPSDWINSSVKAVQAALKQATATEENIISIGVDFTSCTMLPAKSDGTPLALLDQFAAEKLAYPKLWKHHGAKSQTDRINQLARDRNEPWLDRYGGIIGLEWFFPKILETLEEAPHIYDATDVWLEAGDWYVWQLVGGDAMSLPRSTCQAGYKAMWHVNEGYPSPDFFAALHPQMKNVVTSKMPGRLIAPGCFAGGLCSEMATRFELKAGTPVSAAIIDAHAGVPGAAAAEAGTLVMVMGTSSCHMLNAREDLHVPGVAGVVSEGILPGYFGYETGQAAVGDAFDWLRKLTGHDNFDQLTTLAEQLPPGTEGVSCLDWMNGCRTPLMDGTLRGAFSGLTLNHGAHHLYRALMEGTAFGFRWIVEVLREHDVPVNRFVATGGLPHHNPLLIQIYADVIGEPIEVHPSKQGPALGAAILGVLAAGSDISGFSSAQEAIEAMAGSQPGRPDREPNIIQPDRERKKIYDTVFKSYCRLVDFTREDD